LTQRKPGQFKSYGQGKKFESLFDNELVPKDKLTEEKRAEINQEADQINETCVSYFLHIIPLSYLNPTNIRNPDTTASSPTRTKMAGATNPVPWWSVYILILICLPGASY
jgi:hypothetical protein